MEKKDWKFDSLNTEQTPLIMEQCPLDRRKSKIEMFDESS